MTILEIGNKRNRLLRSFTGIFAAIIVFNGSALVNQQVYAGDQQYLDLINDEAQHLNKVDNIVEPRKQALPVATNNSQPIQPPTSGTNSFISDVYSKLNSRQKKANSDKYYYLEQLDDEAQELKSNKRSPNNTANRAQATQKKTQDPYADSAGDDYLSVINQEGNGLNNDVSNTINNTISKQQLEQQQKQLINITEAQREELEFALKNKIPGIYHFYKKLGISQKRIVVNEYFKSKRISTASKTILRLYGGKLTY